MQEDNGYSMYCPKCGAVMNSNARYCMRCGYLNVEHDANQSIKNYIKNEEQTYEVGSGKFMINNMGKDMRKSIATDTGNKLICFLLNYLFYILSLIVSFYYSTKGSFQFYDIVHSLFPLLAIFISLFFFYIYSFEIVFTKCNKKWWYTLIPIYIMIVLSELLFHKKWIGLLTLVPIVGQVLSLVMIYRLGKSFSYSGILTVLFPFIYIPLIAFGVHTYQGYMFVNDRSWFTVEREYKAKKCFLFTFFLFFVAGIAAIVFTNFGCIKENVVKLNNYYYVHASKKLVHKAKIKIDAEDVLCNKEYGPGDIYYFSFENLGGVIYLPFYSFHSMITGYVRVDYTGQEEKYYVSLSDGKKGFPETLIEDIQLDTVLDGYSAVSKIPVSANLCNFMN